MHLRFHRIQRCHLEPITASEMKFLTSLLILAVALSAVSAGYSRGWYPSYGHSTPLVYSGSVYPSYYSGWSGSGWNNGWNNGWNGWNNGWNGWNKGWRGGWW